LRGAPVAGVRLPSERERPADPRRVGFQDDPSSEHLEQSQSALRTVGDLVSMSQPASARALRVCFCHVRLPPRLPFNLFGFNILRVTEQGDLAEDPHGDDEILYALIVNQPVELQREVAVAFLNDLVGRQAMLADVMAERRSLGELPDLTVSADAASAEMSSDGLRFSLRHAAEALKTRAAGAGYRLEIRYQMDPLPQRDDVVRRIKLLRELYNVQSDVRQAVDGTVSVIGGRPAMLRGGSEEIRAWVQRHTALLGVRQFTNQATRDSDVSGNGYLDFGFLGLDPTIRCLRPEEVEIAGHERFRLHSDTGSHELGRVAHLRGLEQFGSPYGISPWEPLLYTLQRKTMIDGVAALAQATLSAGQVSEARREEVEALVRVAEAVDRETKQRLDALLWFPRRRLAEVEGDLYFSGQELMR
jgi:hypothetical protein